MNSFCFPSNNYNYDSQFIKHKIYKYQKILEVAKQYICVFALAQNENIYSSFMVGLIVTVGSRKVNIFTQIYSSKKI